MKVAILCGGQGTRLREETEFRPKPMAEIGGRPILVHIMELYARHGYSEFVLCLGYKSEIIKQYFLNYQVLNSDFTIDLEWPHRIEIHRAMSRPSWRVTLADTGAQAMTGARVKRIERYIDGDEFMLTYGDGLADIDIGKLVEFHRGHGKLATVAGVRPPARFGELTAIGSAAVAFTEKPQTSQGLINGGFFVFNRRVFDYLGADDSCVLEREPLERLATDGELMVFSHTGFWQCLDTPRDLLRLQELWHTGNVPWMATGDE